MRVFFDTSSFVKRFVEEVGSDKADAIIHSASEIGLSIICFPEIISALNRKRRTGVLDQEIYITLKKDILDDIEDADIINLTPNVIKKTIELLENNLLRSLDAIHIACAIEWQADLFVSSDQRQIIAANAAGLKIEFIEGIRAN